MKDIPVGICQCGCGSPTNIVSRDDRSRGKVASLPYRYLKGHHRRITGPDYKVSNTGCWIWIKTTGLNGYGMLYRDGRRQYAHRYYYTRLVGEIPSGLVIDHLCMVKLCVNPKHLELVTVAENTRRGFAAKRACK